MRRSTSRTVSRYSLTFVRSAGAELPLQPGDVFAHPVEQAGALAERGAPLRRAAAFAEEALEDDARMRFRRQRGGGRRPREVVLVDAGVAVVALPHHFHQIHRQLQRRQLRLLPHLLRGDLIDGRAEVVVAAFGPLRFRRAQERRVRRGVRARIRVLQLHVADDGDVVHHGRQRAERAATAPSARLSPGGVQREMSEPIGM